MHEGSKCFILQICIIICDAIRPFDTVWFRIKFRSVFFEKSGTAIFSWITEGYGVIQPCLLTDWHCIDGEQNLLDCRKIRGEAVYNKKPGRFRNSHTDSLVCTLSVCFRTGHPEWLLPSASWLLNNIWSYSSIWLHSWKLVNMNLCSWEFLFPHPLQPSNYLTFVHVQLASYHAINLSLPLYLQSICALIQCL